MERFLLMSGSSECLPFGGPHINLPPSVASLTSLPLMHVSEVVGGFSKKGCKRYCINLDVFFPFCRWSFGGLILRDPINGFAS